MSGAATPPLSLAEVRRRLRMSSDEASLLRWAAVLRVDPRAGARALSRLLERRIAAQRADACRIEDLFARRRALRRAGVRYVAGVDEVGVGPLAGPVVAAAVVLPDEVVLPGLDDSKRLVARDRERLAAAIREQAIAVAVAEIPPEEIDRINIRQASLRALTRAVAGLRPQPHHVLVDAYTLPGLGTPQTALVHGDAVDGSIAAASIVAKVHRDALLRRLDREHPGYGFSRNAGYGTAEHLAALRRLGPSPVHRRSFAPVAACRAAT